MKIALKDIAETIGATVEGDASLEVTGLASLSEAVSGDLSFLSRAKYAKEAESTKATAIIAGSDWEGPAHCVVLRVKDPDRAFMLAAQAFTPEGPARAAGVDSTSVVDAGAEVDPSAHIGPLCVIEAGAKVGQDCVLVAGCFVGSHSTIGEGSFLHANVSVRERVTIGARAVLHCGAVIGSDGFGYVKEGEKWHKIPQIGAVVLGDDVEIGANATIDRARFGKTVIEDGVKIDNLVQVAHNVCIGANTAMAAQVGIAGSTVIGRNVQLGGQAGVAGHVKIGDHSVVGAQAGVTKDIPEKIFVSGFPAMPHRQTMKMQANMLRVPQLKKKIAELEEKMKAFEEDTEGSKG
jgi:UDP-3-O-[3-hydroxymyristoyl] glucosamine N-acyltransferase